MNIKKLIIGAVGVLLLAGAGIGSLSARMTDLEVVEYVKSRNAAGISEKQIGRELAARGVTADQVERIQRTYNASTSGRKDVGETPATSDAGQRTHESSEAGLRETSSADRQPLDDAPVAGENRVDIGRREIYGHNVFNENRLTFAPGANLATPQNYVLGPGDEILIDIWGENEEHVRQTISPEGTIMITGVGPIQLGGKTVKEADSTVRDRFSRKFSGVSEGRSGVSVSLGQVRSITIDVMGEVASPGTFRVSPFSTVFHALYNAGGINNIGSLRNIEVLRNGKRVANVDIYDYLFKGKQTGNIRLQEGDVIIVPTYGELVSVEGNVKRPMQYEIKPGETVNNLINYSGGFTGDAYTDMVRLARQTGRENQLYNIDSASFDNYTLKNGDVVTVGTILDRYNNRVEVKGAVMRPGVFALGSDVFTLRDLIAKADGLAEDAFSGRVMLYREGPDLSLEVEALDLGSILNGTAPDVELRRNDLVVVSSIHEISDRGQLRIEGQVANPGSYPYAAGTTVEDLILQAGGLLRGASTARVDVARRIVDPTADEASNEVAETFELSIENGLVVNEDGENFVLQPYDVVTVRRSPGYSSQKFVTIEGEVAFTGRYVIVNKNERLSDFIARAGGVTEHSYVKGASLIRLLTDTERRARIQAYERIRNGAMNDSTNMAAITLDDQYSVGINLEKALANPGGNYDIVLMPGDRLYVPQQISTVTIMGEVMCPTSMTFLEGKKLKDYVKSAGGYGEDADKGKVFIVYLNGTVTQGKGGTPIEPGCQIIVPSKKITSKKTSFSEIMGYISSFTSLGVMAASIASLLKK